MIVLNNEEMLNVKGGALKFKVLSAIVGGVTVFILGFIDGIVHPKRCN